MIKQRLTSWLLLFILYSVKFITASGGQTIILTPPHPTHSKTAKTKTKETHKTEDRVTMVQPNEIVNVIHFFDEWTRCIGSSYQKDSLYRHGKFDSCTAQWNDLKTAMKAKTTSDPEEAERLLAQTHYRKNLGSDLTQSPTAGVIWDLKEKPCWEEV
jgi:hypothetical protein